MQKIVSLLIKNYFFFLQGEDYRFHELKNKLDPNDDRIPGNVKCYLYEKM